MGFRSTSFARLAVLGALVPVCGIGVGYFAADVERLQLSKNLNFTTEAEAHTRDLATSSYVRLASHEKGISSLSTEAGRLFGVSNKGPRADRYPEVVQTMTKQPPPKVQVASLTGVERDITGALPREAAPQRDEATDREFLLLQSIERAAKADRVTETIDRTAGMIPEPLDTRSSSTLFMASLLSPQGYNFPEADTKPDGPVKLPRGLTFQGETEDEYQARQRRCLATAIYFEARGEPVAGQLAVAQVVMNRVRSSLYPDTICGVIFQGQHRRTGCQFSFTCDGIADVPREQDQWLQSNQLAKKVTDGEVWSEEIGHATHYHATYVRPAWRRQLDHVKKVGRHIFYTVRNEQIEDPLTLPENQGKGLALAKSE